MRTAAYKVDVASDRRRRENVPRHILCSASSEKNRMLACRFGEHRDNSRNSQSVFLVVMGFSLLSASEFLPTEKWRCAKQ